MIYFDHNATTPLDSNVFEAMCPFLTNCYANPSSLYSEGRKARAAIELAREQVANLVNAHPSQVIFTGGGTEANNLAIKGCVGGMAMGSLISSPIEHPSVRDVVSSLSSSTQTRYLAVDSNGKLTSDYDALLAETTPSLVSLMFANNETGVLQDVAAMASSCKSYGHILHTDAVQAAGKIKVDFSELGVNLMTLSAHKIYGPKGVGALIYDKSLDLEPIIYGGGQEKGLWSGTENVAAIVGFGKAASIAQQNLQNNYGKLIELRNYFETKLKQIEGIKIFSENCERIPNTCFFALPGIDGETLLMHLDNCGIAVASGSACSSKSDKPSHVLMAMGVDEQLARSAIRVSFGLQNSKQEIDVLLEALGLQARIISSFKI